MYLLASAYGEEESLTVLCKPGFTSRFHSFVFKQHKRTLHLWLCRSISSTVKPFPGQSLCTCFWSYLLHPAISLRRAFKISVQIGWWSAPNQMRTTKRRGVEKGLNTFMRDGYIIKRAAISPRVVFHLVWQHGLAALQVQVLLIVFVALSLQNSFW